MSTITLQPGDVALDPEARWVIDDSIYFDSIGEQVTGSKSTDDLEANLRHGLVQVELLRAAESGLLPAAHVPAVATMLRDVLRQARERIEWDREGKQKFLAGDSGYGMYAEDPADVPAMYDRQIANSEREVAACEAFLALARVTEATA
jgi:hypothetical protein